MGYLIILSFYEKAISKTPLEKVSIRSYGMKHVKIKRGEEKMKGLRGWPFGPPGDPGVNPCGEGDGFGGPVPG